MIRQYRAKSRNSIYYTLFFLMFGLIFFRYCYYGFTYWQQLDDYIQYHNYTAYNSDIPELINKLGLLSSRPLAGLADLYVWSHFYNRMIAAVAIISAMYAASAVLFHRVFSRHFNTGFLFFVIYALLPLGIEGTYWISASSRIVVGLLFASLSLLFFDRWCEKGRIPNLVLFAVFQLAAFCFYEQIVLLSGAATLVIMLCSAGKSEKRPLWGFLMFAGAGIYFVIITSLAESGVYGARTDVFLPWQENWLQGCFVPGLKQIGYVFTTGMFATLGRGLKRGISFLISEPNLICIIIFVALSLSMFFVTKKVKRENARFWAEFLAGLFLTAAPLLLFFIIKNPWFGVRNAVPSFLGLALMIDAVFDLIFGGTQKAPKVQAAIVSLLCLLCCVATVSELHDYRDTTLDDRQIVKAATDTIVADGWVEGDTIWMLNVDGSYTENANFYFHEHVYGVTSSDWALTGAVYAYAGRDDLPLVSPVSQFCTMTDDGSFNPETARCYFYKEGKFIPVSLEASVGGEWLVRDSSNKNYGAIIVKDGSVQLVI